MVALLKPDDENQSNLSIQDIEFLIRNNVDEKRLDFFLGGSELIQILRRLNQGRRRKTDISDFFLEDLWGRLQQVIDLIEDKESREQITSIVLLKAEDAEVLDFESPPPGGWRRRQGD